MPAKRSHELRDPIHNFVRFDNQEKLLINSWPMQRLRHICQLGLLPYVYPGAIHSRFEHSMGVMELATRTFEAVSANVHDGVRDIFPDTDMLVHWRRVLRAAALCHDMGHLPFSHALERGLWPHNWDHEQMTVEVIKCEELSGIWQEMRLNPDDVSKIAVGPRYLPGVAFTEWETLLSEIITHDVFGADRMDYLLRDSHHAGVQYGKFDLYRLVDTLRILPGAGGQETEEPSLGIDEGGLHSAEALILARFFMYRQVYWHNVGVILHIHLKDFLEAAMGDRKFPTNAEEHLRLTDHQVFSDLVDAASDNTSPGHDLSVRVMKRGHFRKVYDLTQRDLTVTPTAHAAVTTALVDRFTVERVRGAYFPPEPGILHFPVNTSDGRVQSSSGLSHVFDHLPVLYAGFVFVDGAVEEEALQWLVDNKGKVLAAAQP